MSGVRVMSEMWAWPCREDELQTLMFCEQGEPVTRRYPLPQPAPQEPSFLTSTPPDFKPRSEPSLSHALWNNNHQMKVSDENFPLLVH